MRLECLHATCATGPGDTSRHYRHTWGSMRATHVLHTCATGPGGGRRGDAAARACCQTSGTATSVVLIASVQLSRVPSPSCPCEFPPKTRSTPAASSSAVCSPPHATCRHCLACADELKHTGPHSAACSPPSTPTAPRPSCPHVLVPDDSTCVCIETCANAYAT